VPPAHLGVTHIGIEMNVRSISAFQHFYRHTIEAQEINETTFKWGSTLFFLSEDCEHQPCVEMRGKGFRYITVQVWKVDAEHAEALTRGAGEARPPTTLGSTARISFITDPDGNWIEISQRASLTGNLST
jgi:catechol 2,3-dioxygenase-like lactoylglutathione lyase family enzyme